MMTENKSLTLVMRPYQCTLSADGPSFTTGFAKKLHGPTIFGRVWQQLAYLSHSAVKYMVLHQWTVVLPYETWTMP